MPRPRKPPVPAPAHARAADELARMVPLVARWIERLLAASDPQLTVAQLLALGAAERGDAVAAVLAERAAVSPAAVSQLLAGLEEAGLLERVRAADDRRRHAIRLTPAGRRALRSARSLLRQELAPRVAVLGPREADALADALTRLTETIGAAPPPPRPPRPPRPRG